MSDATANGGVGERRARKAAWIGFLSLAGIPALVLLDSLIAWVRGWGSGSRLEQVVLGGCGVVLLLAIGLGAAPAGRRFLQRRGMAIHMLALAVAAGLGLVEISLGVLARPQWSLRLHTRQANLKGLFKPSPELMPGVSGDSHVTTNDLGIRGPAIPADRSVYRILCVGGSTTECLYLDDSETWPALMMERLNASGKLGRVWVGNVGISGFSSLNHLKFLRESDLPGQMDCMVFLVGANDFLKYISGRLYEEQWRPLWVRSSTWDLVVRTWVEIRRRQGKQETDAEDVEGRIYVERRRKRQAARKSDGLPDLTPAIEEYRGRLREMIELCREKKVRAVFVTQPMLWRGGLSARAVDLLWLGILRDESFGGVEALARGIDAYNAALLEVCREAGAECIDAAARLSGREEWYYDDAHYNEAGAREMAGIVAEGVMRGGSLP